MVETSTAALGKAHVPYGADGAGNYSASTLGEEHGLAGCWGEVLPLSIMLMPLSALAGCFRVIEEAKPMVLKALSQVTSARAHTHTHTHTHT